MSATLYLRNVPDELMGRLQTLASRTVASVSATAIADLEAATRRLDNASLLVGLSDLQIPTGRIIVELDAVRAER